MLDAQLPQLWSDGLDLDMYARLMFTGEELGFDLAYHVARDVIRREFADQKDLVERDAILPERVDGGHLRLVGHTLLGESWRGQLGAALTRPHRAEIAVTLAIVETRLGRKVAFSHELDQRDQNRLAREEPPSEVKEQRMLRHGSPLS